ncbi:MAG: hypothetical protein NVS9B7_19550 [Flavisolibacter sp.]
MKNIFLILLLTCGLFSQAQVYNNEWIVYSQTYYKFKVGKDGLYRLPQSLLSSSGLGGYGAETFQLWRNGKQVPIYTSVATGVLSVSDYIEFWGKMNDGKPDKELYRDPNYQLNDRYSLETDSAAYFLTIDPVVSDNLRLQSTANNVAGNSLPAESFFLDVFSKYYRDVMNEGYALNVGENLYSSSYDIGEGFTSSDIGLNATATLLTLPNLYIYPSGPNPRFKISVCGNALNNRRYRVNLNTDSIIGKEVDNYGYSVDTTTFPLAKLLNPSPLNLYLTNFTACSNPLSCPYYDGIDIAELDITYPRKFDMGGAANFEFKLGASVQGKFLKMIDFSYGSLPPVLYDLTNGLRLMADTSGGTLKFVLPASSTERRLVLVSEDPLNINTVTSLTTRNFIDYTAAANQGDYLIISNSFLFTGPNGSNPVDDYRVYRNSASGGSYNAKIYLIDQLVDQFGLGIKMNPASIRDFLKLTRNKYTIKPKAVFIIGKGLTYIQQRWYENDPNVYTLNMVPTFGSPGSDILLTAEQGSSLPTMSIGRLSAISPLEVSYYLNKVKEFELAQNTSSPKIQDKAWMKNIMHVTGTSEPGLQGILDSYMASYKQIIKDTLFGGRVSSFSKSSATDVEQINSLAFSNLFAEGISLITYFGHSSSTLLDANFDNPSNYNNTGKYPMFVALGCNAGDIFQFNYGRLQTQSTLSEKFVLAPSHGTIGFISGTHFAIVHYCDVWNNNAYKQYAYKGYGKPIGEILKATAEDMFAFTSQEDFAARCDVEELELHGDPVIKLNPFPKPDYVIEDPLVKISPALVSIKDPFFKVDAKILNIGRAVSTKIVIEVKRTYPNGKTLILRRDTIAGIRYADSISIMVPIDPINDKGLNKITVTADADNAVDEIYETNNSITKDVMIFSTGASPDYPFDYSIVNKQNIKFLASTADPFNSPRQYRMELDTTGLFNSAAKITKTITASGGILEFDPGVLFKDSTVYYWRVAQDTTAGNLVWNRASFIYLSTSELGFNQSHYFQHLSSTASHLLLNSPGNWVYDSVRNNLFIQNGVFGSATDQEGNITVAVNGVAYIRSACVGNSLIFNVFNPKSFKPMLNMTGQPTGLYGSNNNTCAPGRQNNFEYSYMDATSRKMIMDFMDTIPKGSYVVVRTIDNYYVNSSYVQDWMQDTSIYGPGKSLYHKLKGVGMADIDSFNSKKSFEFVYQKGNSNFTPVDAVSKGAFDEIYLSVDVKTPDSTGYVLSPLFGPAKTWKELKWLGSSLELPSKDNENINLIGIKKDGSADTLLRKIPPSQPKVNISFVDGAKYPYLQLQLNTLDTSNYDAYQLNYWRVTGTPVPEGAVAPNLYFQMKDTFEVGEPLDFQIAFKNIGDVSFDSLRVKLTVTDRYNVQHLIPLARQRPLGVNDTLHIVYRIDTKQLVGLNSLYLDVNPDNDQPEQYHFNNIAFRSFYVRPDTLNPLMDVTFDNVHILNNDIISAKPNIVIKLKDESKWNLLNDNSTITVKVKYPDGTIHPYSFTGDTLQFIPAQSAPNTKNTAQAIFKPFFKEDGTYTLIVSGKDMSDNKAGIIQYQVSFDVINKPMISNMLNYPNPFTTSTSFVFTLTGSEVPQNIKVQILTVTGKIIREITKEELGPLHIGRNITEGKWDGKDQFGAPVANGVYLYHVVTNLNGKSLDKFSSQSEGNKDNTDKYFIKGYGKMVKLR